MTTIADLVVTQLLAQPDAVAVRAGGRDLRAAELDRWSAGVAAQRVGRGRAGDADPNGTRGCQVTTFVGASYRAEVCRTGTPAPPDLVQLAHFLPFRGAVS